MVDQSVRDMTDEELKALAADAARESVTEWLGSFDPPPAINFQQSEVLQQLIATGLFETAIGVAMLVLKKHIAETDRLRQRETDLLDANNRYLERARKAEGALAAERAAIVALIRDGKVVERDGHSEAVSFDEDELIAAINARTTLEVQS